MSTHALRMLLACLLAGSLPVAQNAGEVRGPEFAELSARWRAAASDLGVPGAAVAILEGEEVLHLETFGLRDVVRGKPVTPETMFYIASATKPFVAFAAAMLAEEGRLELDDPVRAYLPRFRLADEEARNRITVRDLLCHRPGLNSFPIVFLDAYTGEITEDRYYHFLADVEPLGRVEYTNLHFTLAGRVLEAVTGQLWKEVLREKIFEPAGMQRTTGYATAMYRDANVAYPSIRSGDGFAYASVRKVDETMHAAGGLGTSISDAGRWIALHLGGGEVDGRRLLSEQGVEELLREQSRLVDGSLLGARSGFGLGWMRSSAHGELRIEHGGGYIGTAALLSFLPGPGVGVAVLANTDGAGNAFCELVTDDVYAFFLAADRVDPLPRLVERVSSRSLGGTSEPLLAASGANAAQLALGLERYAGSYWNEHWGTVRLEVEDGALVGRMGNVCFALQALGPVRFRAFSNGALDGAGTFVGTEGEVVALELDLSGYPVRFER